MAHKTADFVEQVHTGFTGTGDYLDAGVSVPTDARAVASQLSTGDTGYFTAQGEDASGNATEGREVFLGTKTATGLARTTIIASTTGSAINWATSVAVRVSLTGPASRILQLDNQLAVPMPVSTLVAGVPNAPPADILNWYVSKRNGLLLPAWVNQYGVDQQAQPQIWGNRVNVWGPGTGTAITSLGLTPTTAATLSHPAPASTTLAESISRVRFSTSTTAGNASGARDGNATLWRGNAAGRGGFFAYCRFMSGSIGLAGGQKFVGLSSSVAALAGEPSALADCWGMGKDTADTNWQFLKRTGTGTVSKTSLGISATALNNTFDLALYSPPNGSSIFVRIDQLNYDGSRTNLLDQNYAVDLPASTTFLSRHVQVRNGATAAADNIDTTGWYTLSDR